MSDDDVNELSFLLKLNKEGEAVADKLFSSKLGNELWGELKYLGCVASINSEIMDDNTLYNLRIPDDFRDRLASNGYVYAKEYSYDDTYSIFRNYDKSTQIFMTCNGYLKIERFDCYIKNNSIFRKIAAVKKKAAAQGTNKPDKAKVVSL